MTGEGIKRYLGVVVAQMYIVHVPTEAVDA